MWIVPQRDSFLPGVVGLHRVARGAIRAGDSYGSGLTAASVSLGSSCNILGKDLRSGETEFDAQSNLAYTDGNVSF